MSSEFREQLSLLRELQRIDTNLHKFRRRLNELPGSIRASEEAFDAVKSQLETAKSELSAVETTKREDELNLASSIESLRSREAKLYAIKTNKEYQAVVKEIADGKRTNREREDRILKGMETIEELNQKITQLNSAFADKESELQKRRSELEAEVAEIRDQMREDEELRPGVVSKIDKKYFRKYEFVGKRHVNALMPVKGGICAGCSTRVTPQLYNDMLRLGEMKTCPSCQRLIYVDTEPADGESAE